MTIGNDLYYLIPRIVYRTSNPLVNDDVDFGMEIGQVWVNTSTGESFICKDNTAGAAKWYKGIFQLSFADDTVPSFQTEINDATTNKQLFITPEIIYNSNSSIAYNVTIPTDSSALTIGPITIDDGYTVTVDGIWTIV
jgi:hypothetical protein